MQEAIEKPRARGIFRLEKFFTDPKTGRALTELGPYEVIESENLLVTAGIQLLEDLLIGAGGTAYNNANSYIGVGDSAAAPAIGQTDLQASSNKLRKAMDATYPSRSSTTITWKSTFGSSDANFAWNEAAMFNASSSGTMLGRLNTGWGTKVSGTTWAMTYTLVIS